MFVEYVQMFFDENKNINDIIKVSIIILDTVIIILLLVIMDIQINKFSNFL